MFKNIPKTTALQYISGLNSLNLDLRDSTGSGWHFANVWSEEGKELRLYGKGTHADTTAFMGYLGIADRSEDLRRMGVPIRSGVYVANHFRAAADITYESLIRYRHVGPVRGSVDFYFPAEDQKEILFKYLLLVRGHVDEVRRELLDDWLSEEFRLIYKRWRTGALQNKEIVFAELGYQ